MYFESFQKETEIAPENELIQLLIENGTTFQKK